MDMVTINESRIRADTFNYIARKGHGALDDLAQASGLTTQSVRRVRKGTRVDLETLIKVEAALRSLGYYDEAMDPIPPLAQETPRTHGGKPSRDVSLIFASELEIMAEKLRSTALEPIEKSQEFREFITNLHKTVEAKIAAIEKSGKTNS